MPKTPKQTYHVTNQRGTYTTQLTARQARLRDLSGATVTVPLTTAQKRALRRWKAQDIGTD